MKTWSIMFAGMAAVLSLGLAVGCKKKAEPTRPALDNSLKGPEVEAAPEASQQEAEVDESKRQAAEQHRKTGKEHVEKREWLKAAEEMEKARPFFDEDPHFVYDIGKAYENLYAANQKREYLVRCRENYEKLIELRPDVAQQPLGTGTVRDFVNYLKKKEEETKP